MLPLILTPKFALSRNGLILRQREDIDRRLWGCMHSVSNPTRLFTAQVLGAMLKEICAALLESDVNVQLVKRLRENVRYSSMMHK